MLENSSNAAIDGETDDADNNGASHDQRQARIPPSKRIEKPLDLARVGHAAGNQADAEENAAGPGNDL